MELNNIYNTDCKEGLTKLESNTIDLCITSPPYYNAKEYSQWETYEDYLKEMKEIFTKVFNVLKEGRMCCVNISVVIEPRKKRSEESKRIPIPFHFVSLMENIGFKFLEDIIWVKPEGSAKNRGGRFFQDRQPVQYKPNIINEYILIFQKPMKGLIDKILKSYDQEKKEKSYIEDGYERSNVWYINPCTNSKHLAPFPLEIPYKLIKYYSYIDDIILDPFMGSGTTAIASILLKRNYIGFEIHEEYVKMANENIKNIDKI